jgi:lipopolysaccharide/colanic/teichoic acid biosynthesis glycosyltransferase
MTPPPTATTRVEETTIATFEEAPTVVRESPLEENPRWPVTRLASWSLTLLLAAALYIPSALEAAHGYQLALLLIPAFVATVSARALFETLGSPTDQRRLLGHAATAIAPGVAAGALMAAAGAILMPAWSLGIGIVTVVLATAALTAAGTWTGVEIRFRRELRRVYFVGSSVSLRALERECARHHDRQLVGATAVAGPTDTIDAASLMTHARAVRATVVVLDRAGMRAAGLRRASELDPADVGVRDLVSYYEQEFKKVPLGELSAAWFAFELGSVRQRRAYPILSLAAEIAAGVLLLLLAAPVILLLAVAIKLTSPGPALYRQPRVGKGGKVFTLLKLRTMTEDANEGTGAAWAFSEAHRVTRVGRHLRRFRIDELPQLWNVLRGDLAFIGPRPEQVPIVARLDRELPYYSKRHCIRPGITGWAQVNLGYGGSFEGTLAKLQHDLYYIKHRCLRLDALIVWLTLKAVFAGRG